MQVKIYGERNTGTNYLSRLLQLNVEVREIEGVVPSKLSLLQEWLPGKEWLRDLYFSASFPKTLGWKHACVIESGVLNQHEIVNDDLFFVTLTKNPYAWLLSLYRRPYHQKYRVKPDFETFLQMPWKTVSRDNLGVRAVSSPVELWNRKVSSYGNIDDMRAVHVSSEELVSEPEQVLDRICDKFALGRKNSSFLDHESSTKKDGKDRQYYNNYYRNELWREKLSDRAIELIDSRLDKALVRKLGYRMLGERGDDAVIR